MNSKPLQSRITSLMINRFFFTFLLYTIRSPKEYMCSSLSRDMIEHTKYLGYLLCPFGQILTLQPMQSTTVIPYVPSILGQVRDPISLPKINMSEPRFESKDLQKLTSISLFDEY